MPSSARLKQLELVGRGAMSEVFRGELLGERGTARLVAIKRLRSERQNDAEAVELFVNEAKLALRVSHSSLVQALEFARDERGYYLLCEWLSGVPLSVVRQSLGSLPAAVVYFIGRQLCGAVRYLHELRNERGQTSAIVHRDICPANVWILENGAIKLGDFGLACCPNDHASFAAPAGGTPQFAAPEQLAGQGADERSDIYGIGTTLMALSDDLPVAFVDVLNKATARDVEQRFATVALFEEALDVLEQQSGFSSDKGIIEKFVGEKRNLFKAPPPPNLDQAMQSVMGEALNRVQPVSLAPALRASTKRSRGFVAALVGLGFFLIAAAVWRASRQPLSSSEKPVPVAIATPQPAESPMLMNETAQSLSAPAAVQQSAPKVQKRVVMPTVTGTMSLNAEPWAEVTIDGRGVGTTPLRELSLSAGFHQLRLVHPPQSLRYETTFEVKAQKKQKMFIDLRRQTVESYQD